MIRIIFHQFDSKEEAIDNAQASGKLLIKLVYRDKTYTITVYEKDSFVRFVERTIEAYQELFVCEAFIIVDEPITEALLNKKIASLTPLYFSKLLHD